MCTFARIESAASSPSIVRLPRMTTASLLSVLAVVMVMAHAGAAVAVNRYVEEFDTETFKDAAHTSADWNTAAGKLELFPFEGSLLGTYGSPGVANKVALSGSVAYVADGAPGLRIVNVSDPSSPTLLGMLNTTGDAKAVAISGTAAYVADGVSGLRKTDFPQVRKLLFAR